MEPALLDTDILSELLKQQNPSVRTKAATYLKAHGQFAFSAFTRFEVSRGYKEKQATTILTRFETFCSHSLILPVTESVFVIGKYEHFSEPQKRMYFVFDTRAGSVREFGELSDFNDYCVSLELNFPFPKRSGNRR